MSTAGGNQRVLLVYIEPTPYVQALVAAIAAIWRSGIDVVYTGADVSQTWARALNPGYECMLPARPTTALWTIGRRLHRYDLLHLAGWGHPVLLGALIAGALRGLPMTVETDTQLHPPAQLLRRAVKRCVYPWLFRAPSLFLPAGHRQAAYLRHYGVLNDRIRIAQMTVDVVQMAAFHSKQSPERRWCVRRRHGLAADAVLFMFVGRLEPHKGVLTLLSAFHRLSQTTPAALLIVGEGSLSDAVRVAAASDPALKYAGRLDGEALWQAYGAADVLVLPSEFEPWGLVVNEAMAFELPVIVTRNVGCVDDLVARDETGLVIDPGSAEVLAGAMHRLARQPDTRRRMAREAKKRIAGWTIENEARNICSAWAEALAK